MEVIRQHQLAGEGFGLVLVLESFKDLRSAVFAKLFHFFRSDFAVGDFAPDGEITTFFLPVGAIVRLGANLDVAAAFWAFADGGIKGYIAFVTEFETA